MVEARRANPSPANEDDMPDDEYFQGCSRQRKQTNVEHTQRLGASPSGVEVTAEQAEGALGRTMATELDVDISEAVDGDTKEEEEALARHQVNPNVVDCACVSWQPDAPSAASAGIVGWEADLLARLLSRADFACTTSGVNRKLNKGLSDLTVNFLAEFQRVAAAEEYLATVHELDPTQKLIVDVMAEWAQKRKGWTSTYSARGSAKRSPPLPPKSQLLLLSTAGTGKTRTAKVGITEVRIPLGSYDNVLTMAFNGMAPANLGASASTIDNIFHTIHCEAGEDLTSVDLDNLVDELQHVQLIVIDEMSTCGAASPEGVSRHMQQVARVVWWRIFKRAPPANMGPFGGMGVVLMGDFAPFPPVLSTRACLLWRVAVLPLDASLWLASKHSTMFNTSFGSSVFIGTRECVHSKSPP